MDSAQERAARVLVVDDDSGMRGQVSDYLAAHGFAVRAACDAAEMDRLIKAEACDILILDVMMPGEDGLSVCRRMAGRADLGIIMLSAAGDDIDRILGLELGADDYLPKPCNPRELLARVKALQRRRELTGTPKDSRSRVTFAGFELDASRRQLRAPDGALSVLTAGELAVLLVFIDHPRRVLSREELLELSRGEEIDVFDRAIDVQISRLRRKLGETEAEGIIRTQRGAGYVFEAHVSRL